MNMEYNLRSNLIMISKWKKISSLLTKICLKENQSVNTLSKDADSFYTSNGPMATRNFYTNSSPSTTATSSTSTGSTVREYIVFSAKISPMLTSYNNFHFSSKSINCWTTSKMNHPNPSPVYSR